MTENDIRKLERYSKRELIEMLEAIANGHLELEREKESLDGCYAIAELAYKGAREQAEKAKAERDAYRETLMRLAVELEGLFRGAGRAEAMAFEHFRGMTVEDMREELAKAKAR